MRDLVAELVSACGMQAELGESPLWQHDVGLRWLDIEGERMFTLRREGVFSAIELAVAVTAIELGPGANLVAVTRTGFGWLDPTTGQVERISDVVDGETVTMNDGAVDAAGRCWAGSAVLDDSWRGALYRLDGADATIQLDKLGMSNGIDWSPADDVLYHVDSSAGVLTAWDYDVVSGQLGHGRTLLEVPAETGLPDGLTVDAAGNIWLAVWGTGEVWCLEPHRGETTMRVRVPTPFPTSCAFGGPDLSTLYITTANYQQPAGGGLLYAVDAPVTGRMPHRFAGVPS